MSSELANQTQRTFFGRSPLLLRIVLFLVFALALGVRFISLTQPPLDFHADRQLRGAIIARGMYNQMLPNADPNIRQTAITLWKSEEIYEPQIFERIVALTYLVVGGEYLWIARIFAILFWLIGGAALYDLSRRLTSVDGGITALSFYLFLPFGVDASRSFQPDPFMVMWLLWAVWAIHRWSQEKTWKLTILAGMLGGVAILVKMTAAFMLAPVAVAVVLTVWGLKGAVRSRQVWATAGMMVAIPLVYALAIGQRSTDFIKFWVVDMSGLLLKPSFYFGWLALVRSLIDLGVILVALAGVFLFSRSGRAIAAGLWGGFLVYGLCFPSQIHTHDYYNLPLVPIVAFSLAPVGSMVLEKIAAHKFFWRLAFTGLILLSVAYPTWLARNSLVLQNYQYEPAAWKRMGEALPTNGKIIALTHEYGIRLKYYGLRMVFIWPVGADFALTKDRQGNLDTNFDSFFASQTDGMDYFLVTLFTELDNQPQLKAKLYDHYTIASQGDGYVLFDLHHPK